MEKGWYTWCHNQVLKAVANANCTGIRWNKHQLTVGRSMAFIWAGGEASKAAEELDWRASLSS